MNGKLVQKGWHLGTSKGVETLMPCANVHNCGLGQSEALHFNSPAEYETHLATEAANSGNSHLNGFSKVGSISIDPPIVSFNEVFHVGTFQGGDRKELSYEGDGLSVSRDPSVWAGIARLGGDTWTLTRADGDPLRFADFRGLDSETVEAIRSWGVTNGWVHQQPFYRVEFEDENEDICWMEFESHDEAWDEADSMGGEISETLAWRPTDTFPMDRVDRDSDPLDMLLSVYVTKQRPDVDGVWWDDTFNPANYSCPRGVLLRPLDAYSKVKE